MTHHVMWYLLVGEGLEGLEGSTAGDRCHLRIGCHRHRPVTWAACGRCRLQSPNETRRYLYNTYIYFKPNLFNVVKTIIKHPQNHHKWVVYI
jgi:hypothetical protein